MRRTSQPLRTAAHPDVVVQDEPQVDHLEPLMVKFLENTGSCDDDVHQHLGGTDRANEPLHHVQPRRNGVKRIPRSVAKKGWRRGDSPLRHRGKESAENMTYFGVEFLT